MQVDEAYSQLSRHPDYRVLRRLEMREIFQERTNEPVLKVIILDSETTGLAQGKDKLVELGMLAVTVGADTGICYAIMDFFNELEDPGIPMTPEAAAVNHITDEMLAGKQFDDARVDQFIENADLVIAHNAGFDRGMIEARFPQFASLNWACSMREVKWKEIGFSSTSLEYLGLKSGFFFEGHRADIDCRALLEVLRQQFSATSTILKILVEQSRLEEVRLWALNAPFEKKDIFKGRRYFWSDGSDGRPKAWHTTLSKEAGREELKWLYNQVYQRPATIRIDIINAKTRYADRVFSTKSHELREPKP